MAYFKKMQNDCFEIQTNRDIYNVCTLPKWASNFTQMYKCMSTKK